MKEQEDQEKEFKRKLWNDLHVWAARFTENPDEASIARAGEWLETWFASFPVDCPCRAEWEKIMAICPPPIKDGGLALFWWTVAAHDRVNMLLAKPMWANRSRRHRLVSSLLDPALVPAETISTYRVRIEREAVNRI